MAKLTIGMAHYDDFDGVYFSIQALRMYHDMSDIELIVVDNSPHTDAGKTVSTFINDIAFAKYIAYDEVVGAANAKNRIFHEAQTDLVLCIDCHVMLPPGSIRRLINWYNFNPNNKDLLTGPLVYNNLHDIATHFDLSWRGDMWGIWSRAWSCRCGRHFSISIPLNLPADAVVRDLMDYSTIYTQCPDCGADYPKISYVDHETYFHNIGCKQLGLNINDHPFEIPANGMGLFACRREAWLGFNQAFRGFGGEEGYIHIKYRQAGQRCLNLPFLPWVHRFLRSNAVSYPLNYWDRVRNYVIGHQELRLSIDDIHENFVGSLKPLDQKSWDYLVEDPIANIDAPCSECQHIGSNIDEAFAWTATHPHNMGCHMPRFRELASKCEHITAMVKQKEFDITLLAGRPKTLRVYTLEPSPIHKQLADLADGIDYKNESIDWLALDDIEETDLLVIHSFHRADRLYAELSKFGKKVRRWILLRSTGAYGEEGESFGPGLFPAMRRYMRENQEWSVIEHNKDDFGYTLLSRDPADKKKLPPFTKMVWNYTLALARHNLSGRKTAKIETIESRLDKCSLCIYRTHNRCAICGCFLDVGPGEMDGKVLWPESFCNLGEWFEEDG
jgi:glycosyltransferase involved in cell wall biosynthesis